MDKCEIEKLQNVQLEIMDFIHDICVKNSIPYYLVGGSVIGAVRHKGHIPWDVDIDIGMHRENYDRFREYCLTHKFENYSYHDYTNTPNFIPPHALLCKNGTAVRTKFSKYNKRQREYGIFVDIIPLDNAPSDIKELRKLEKKIRFVQKIKARKVCYFYNDFSAHKAQHIIKKMISMSLFWISINRLNALEDKTMRLYNGSTSDLWVAMAGRYSFDKECKPKTIYGEPTLMEFAGRMYYVPEQAHEYLSMTYGDYMKIPSFEVQNEGYSYYETITFEE